MGKNVKWDITYKCNLNCAHCINGNFLNNIKDELDLEEVREVIKRLKKSGITYVHLLGGEPTARTDIMDIFGEFQLNNLDFGFNTNGLKLINANFRERLINNSALKNIIFSLEGPNAELNDIIRGKKVFEVTYNNLKETISLKRRLGRNDLKITVNTVVSKLNYLYINDMIRFCIENKVDELVLLQFIPEGNAHNNNYSLGTKETLDLINNISTFLEDNEVRECLRIVPRFVFPLAQKYAEVVLGKYFPLATSMCGAGSNFFYLNNKGQLYPCDRYRQVIDESGCDNKLLESEFWDIVSYKEFNDIFEMSESDKIYSLYEPCNKCECLQKTCYPCVALSEGNKKVSIDICKKMMEEIENVSNK